MTNPPDNTINLKKKIRHEARSLRQALTDKQLLLADQQVALQYQHYYSKKNFKSAGIYLQNDNELGTNHLIKELLQTDCKLYLPNISDYTNKQIQFTRYQQHSSMRINRFGIPEPVSDEFISVPQLDIIFLPLTAFDLHGNRLGMGGGYYDRALAGISGEKPILVGLAYDFQEVPACPIESFDHSIHMIMTPTRVLHF